MQTTDSRAAPPAPALPALRAELQRSVLQDAALMHEAARRDDLVAVGLLAHRVKGMSLMCGAVEFAETCSLVSLACRAGELSGMRQALAVFDAMAAALPSYLDNLDDDAGTPITALAPEKENPMLCDGLKFLVVEDHDFQRKLIVGFLERLGAQQVDSFSNGEAALAAMMDPQQDADIAVLDLSMPRMDGSDLMRQLGNAPRPLSIIVNSALSPSLLASLLLQARRLRIRLLGAISKPMTGAKLAPLIALHHRAVPAVPQESP